MFRGTLARGFSSLSVRNFRLVAAGQLVSVAGTWMMVVAQDWLVLSLARDSATALATVTALQFTPLMLFTLYGGRLADRHDKRRLLVVANIVSGALALALALLDLSGAARLWHVHLFAFALGTVTAVETPARMSFVSGLVGADLLPNASALSAAYFNVARVAGPALAGLLISAFGTGWVMLLNAVSYAGTVAGLRMMRTSELHRSGRTAEKGGVADGLRYVTTRPDLLLPVALVAVIGLFGLNFQLILPLLAKTVFHADAAFFGLLTTAFAAGSLLAALVGTQRRAHPPARTVILSARLRSPGDGGRVGPRLRLRTRPAGAHGLRLPVLRAGRQPPNPAGQRPRVPGPSDGPLHADPAGIDTPGRRARRLAGAATGGSGWALGRRAGVDGGGARGADGGRESQERGRRRRAHRRSVRRRRGRGSGAPAARCRGRPPSPERRPSRDHEQPRERR
jgi:MFS family permease